jgi:hypothetical protein
VSSGLVAARLLLLKRPGVAFNWRDAQASPAATLACGDVGKRRECSAKNGSGTEAITRARKTKHAQPLTGGPKEDLTQHILCDNLSRSDGLSNLNGMLATLEENQIPSEQVHCPEQIRGCHKIVQS